MRNPHPFSRLKPPNSIPKIPPKTKKKLCLNLNSSLFFPAMGVLSQSALEHFPLVQTVHKPTSSFFNGVPVIDLSAPDAKTLIVKACEEFGFFKVINHGVPMEVLTSLEGEAKEFFNLTQSEKEKAGPPDPFGYGSKKIGSNGDVGWVEFLLFNTNLQVVSNKSLLPIFHENFRCGVDKYVEAMKKLAYEALELMAEGLEIEPRNVLSRILRDEKSDSCFRLNHYPPCPELQTALSGWNLIGFGEHTDPQIVSVLRSNNTAGLQICLRDGTWVSVPPDNTSFFISVGDSLQVLTNGRFRSVKHRVLADTKKSRISMIYFGGPPLTEKIAPLPSLLAEGNESLYKEFTWSEYKKSAYKSRLADNRLDQFKKSAGQ